MNITIKITTAVPGKIESLAGIIGSIVDTRIAGSDIIISGPITEIIADDGTIIDRESIIIEDADIKGDPSISNGSIAREEAAPRGSLIQPRIA